jgi:2-C-methyl-D-erythritol 4-phosphate cytidylyltransferase
VSARCFALIPAAGVGLRAGGPIPKQYLPVGGAPMILHAVAAFAAVPAIERIAIVIAPDDPYFDTLMPPAGRPDDVDVVRDGGATRDASVANGLAALSGLADDDDWILVHDAARCGITPALIERLIARIADDPVGGLLAVPLDDTIKRAAVATADAQPTTDETVDRRGLWRAQTPQMFRYRVLVDALSAARARGIAITDEASAIEATGTRALLVPGSPRNFKVTTADDLLMMDLLLQAAPSSISDPLASA